jgi:hypothetical protein
MTNPVVLYGTQSNGETLPVQVDATGRLIAEGLPGPQGEQGDPGPQGEKGEKGDTGGMELPPNPQEGQVLGWVNGELAWMNTGTAFDLEYLVIGGGGKSGIPEGFSYHSGGGAGGYISGVRGERSGGGMNSAGPLSLELTGGGLSFDVLAGGPQGDSMFSGTTFNIQAKAGGTVNLNGGVGGSGAGGGQLNTGGAGGTGSVGTAEQGYKGADGQGWQAGSCSGSNFWCHYLCGPYNGGRGGGGAGGAGAAPRGGAGVTSSITGTPVTYAAGGRGTSQCASEQVDPTGYQNFGSGGCLSYGPKGGAVILRYPSYVVMTAREGGSATLEVVDDGAYTVATITGGYCVLMAAFKTGYVVSKLRELKTQ